MPISARRSNAKSVRAAPQSGFTLVETLVVLLVLALLAGVAILNTPGPERRLMAQAERMATFIAFGAQESVMTNRPHAVIVRADGYELQRRGPAGLERVAPGGVTGFRRFNDGVQAEVDPAAGPLAVFDVLGGATPGRVRLTMAGARVDVMVAEDGGVRVARAP
jgi:general secretion pathway protein H